MSPEFVTVFAEFFTYIPTLGFSESEASPNVIFPLFNTFPFSAIIPISLADDVPVIFPVFVRVPVPFASIPVIPPVVPVLFTRLIFTSFTGFVPSKSTAVPFPVALPEYLYSKVFPAPFTSEIPFV